jgi:2-dehydropantoate 2-reductase
MKICVFGAGAIGGHMAVRLAQAGAEISVVARGEHLRGIQRDGLTVHAVDRTMHETPQATDDPRTLGPQDAVIVTVKAPALPSVAATIAPLLHAQTSVAFVMNGIPWWYFLDHGGPLDGRSLPAIDPGDAIRRAVGRERTIGGVVYSAATVVAPGVIHAENPNSRVILGEPNGQASPRAEAIASLLRMGGIGGEVTTAIRDTVWTKLITNLANAPLCLLAQATVEQVYAEPACEEVAVRVLKEAGTIAAALGRQVDFDLDKHLERARGMAHKPSLAQDLELGRPTEIAALLEMPLELARMAGVAAPTLDFLVALARVRLRTAGLYDAAKTEPS